ncbi:MAG: hypothetical protein ACWGHO_00545 [Candidatus Moraniibacteriota bacterium]
MKLNNIFKFIALFLLIIFVSYVCIETKIFIRLLSRDFFALIFFLPLLWALLFLFTLSFFDKNILNLLFVFLFIISILWCVFPSGFIDSISDPCYEVRSIYGEGKGRWEYEKDGHKCVGKSVGTSIIFRTPEQN